MKRHIVISGLFLFLAALNTPISAADDSACMRFFQNSGAVLDFRESTAAQTAARDTKPAPPASPSNKADAEYDYGSNLNDLGVMYARGGKMPQSYGEALRWFSIAALQGQRDALYNLGVMYVTGRGVDRNARIAAGWFKSAADQDDAAAQNILGALYETGCGVTQSDAEASRLYRLSADKFWIAAQDNLARMYLAERSNPHEAATWHALQQKHKGPKAAYILAEEFARGEVMPQSYTRAGIWFRIAATQGDIRAAYRLGGMYGAGKELPQNLAEAARWYQLAAEQGHAGAQYEIGRMYGSGQGVKQDLVVAYAWLDIAARQGVKKAAELRDQWAQNMPRPSFYAAQRLKKEMLQRSGIITKQPQMEQIAFDAPSKSDASGEE